MEKEGQSMERDWGKKREEPDAGSSGGGRSVLGIKKEKKRRMVLSDSESDEHCTLAKKKRNHSAFRDRNAIERLTSEEGRVEKDGGSTQTDITKKVLESGLDRKRAREVIKGDNAVKRSKMEGVGEKKIKANTMECIDEGKRSRGDHVPNLKPVVPSYRLKEATIQGIVLSSADKACKSGRKEVRSKEHSSQRRPQVLEDHSGGTVAGKRKDSGISKQEVIRVQGKGGVLRILPSNRKVAGLEKDRNQREDDEYGKHEMSSPSVNHQTAFRSDVVSNIGSSSMKKSSLSQKTRLHQVKEGKNRPREAKEDKFRPQEAKDKINRPPEPKAEKIGANVEKAENRSLVRKSGKSIFPDSKAEKIRSTETKAVKIGSTDAKAERFSSRENKAKKISPHEGKTRQVKANVVGLPKVNSSVKFKGEDDSSLRTLLNDKENTKGARGRRNTVKRKLREELKTILLNAGWKIDLRPRRGRDYEDNVYVSPEGTGYWSITKAYAVFQEQFKGKHDDKGKALSGKSSSASTGISRPYSAIPMEALHMLKRKRRRKEDIDDSQRKDGLVRKRKRKGKDISGRRKVNSLVDFSAKHNVASTSRKPHSQSNDKKQSGRALLVRGANLEVDACFDEYVPYAWKRTVLSWMIDLGIVPANGKVKYMNKKKTHMMLEGRITRDGIYCGCCSKVLTISRFEVHAGSKLNQLYENIYVEETGISLLQSQLNAWEQHEEPGRRGFYAIPDAGGDPSDDTCGICGDGGDLICCDSCPSTFHLSCLGIQMLPPGDWHCMYCSCKYCRVASGGASEESSPLLSCLQCEEKYHRECVPEADAIPASSNKIHSSYCGRSCRKVFKGLQKLIGVKNELEGGFSWSLIHNLDEDSTNLNCSLPLRALCNSKIAVAFGIMDECFLPITDRRSGINLIHNIIYSCGSNFKRLNYSGFYTFVLERGDEIICVASVRVHGIRLAEMPFIGTRNVYRRQGMCRRLLNGIEAALCFLNIKKLIVPAMSELSKSWISTFGFKPFQISRKQEIMTINMLVFPCTGLLEKVLQKKKSDDKPLKGNRVAKSEIRHHSMSEVANESSASPSVCMGTRASDMVIVAPKHDPKEGEHTSALDGRIRSTCEATLKLCNAAYELDPSVGTHSKSLADAMTSLTPHPDVVYGDKNLTEDDVQVDASSEHQSKFPLDVSVLDNGTLEMEDTGGVDDTKAPCTGNNLHISVCSLESGMVGTRYDGSEAASTSIISSLPAERDFESTSEHILVSIPEEKCQVATTKANLVTSDDPLVHCSPHIISAPLDGNEDAVLGSSAEPDVHLVDESTVHISHRVKAEAAPLENKSNSSIGDTRENVSEIINGPSNVASGKEIHPSCEPCESHLSDVNCEVVCDTSSCGNQIAGKRLSQQDLHLFQKQPEAILGSSSETTVAMGSSFEQSPYCSDEKSTSCPTLEVAGGTQDVASAYNMSSSGVLKSCKLPANPIDTQNLNCGKTLSTPENHIISEDDGNRASEYTAALPFVVSDRDDATSLGSLNNHPHSSLVAVQSDVTRNVTPIVELTGRSLDIKQDIILASATNDLKEGDEAKAGHTGDEVVALKEGEIPSLEPVQDHDSSSTYSTSEVVEESLNNVSVIQRDSKSINVPNNLASCTTTSSSDGVNIGERNEVVSGCKQATFLRLGHTSAD